MPETSKIVSSPVLGPWLSIMQQISKHEGSNLLSSVPRLITKRLKAAELLFFGLGIVYRLIQDGEFYIMCASACRFADGLLSALPRYTPQPSPRVFRTVERLQNLLQGSSTHEEPLTTEEKLQLLNWVYRNAQHRWLSHGGPLRPRQAGGVNVVIISDPSLTALALISKQQDPKRPVIFESRMHIHKCPRGMVSDPQKEAFDFIWSTLSHADILACQAPSKLDSRLIPQSKVGYVMASVDR